VTTTTNYYTPITQRWVWRRVLWAAVTLFVLGFALAPLRSSVAIWLLLAAIPLALTWFVVWNWSLASSALSRRRSRA
jgi:hypothetical protein